MNTNIVIKVIYVRGEDDCGDCYDNDDDGNDDYMVIAIMIRPIIVTMMIIMLKGI